MRTSLIAAFLLATLLSDLSLAAKQKIIQTQETKPRSSWRQGLLVDGTFHKGTIASDFDTEARQVLACIDKIFYGAHFKQPRPARTTQYPDLTATARK
jgi:hypothetical protein